MLHTLMDENTLPDNVIVDLDVEYKDERGTIIPITDIKMKSCVLIHSKKGTLRANHYHKTDWHFCYVLNGEIDYYYRPCGESYEPKKVKVNKGQLFFTPPLVEHAMVFKKDTSFLTLGRNSRQQKIYEADTVRVELLDPKSYRV